MEGWQKAREFEFAHQPDAHRMCCLQQTIKLEINFKYAVKTHLWIAICSYLLLARIKAVYNSPYSISVIRMLISVSALNKKDLKDCKR